jgi:hypothetical protein
MTHKPAKNANLCDWYMHEGTMRAELCRLVPVVAIEASILNRFSDMFCCNGV